MAPPGPIPAWYLPLSVPGKALHAPAWRHAVAFLRKHGKVWHLVWKEGGRQRSKRLSADRKIAEEKLRSITERQERQAAGLAGWDLFLGEWAEEHVRQLEVREASGELAPATVERAKEALLHFMSWMAVDHPSLRRISQVTPELLAAYRLARTVRRPGLWRCKARAKTINTEVFLLSPAFRSAVKHGALRVNPSTELRKLREKDSRSPRDLSPAEAKRLLAVSRKEFPELHPYLVGYLHTGARRGELFAVEWQDVDLERRILTLRNLKTHRDSRDRTRIVPIHPALARVLRRRRTLQSPWPIIPHETLRREFGRAARAARLPWLTRLHDLRHTFAGALVSAGVELYAVGKLLGHRSPVTTQRYARHRPEALRDAMAKLKF